MTRLYNASGEPMEPSSQWRRWRNRLKSGWTWFFGVITAVSLVLAALSQYVDVFTKIKSFVPGETKAASDISSTMSDDEVSSFIAFPAEPDMPREGAAPAAGKEPPPSVGPQPPVSIQVIPIAVKEPQASVVSSPKASIPVTPAPVKQAKPSIVSPPKASVQVMPAPVQPPPVAPQVTEPVEVTGVAFHQKDRLWM